MKVSHVIHIHSGCGDIDLQSIKPNSLGVLYFIGGNFGEAGIYRSAFDKANYLALYIYMFLKYDYHSLLEQAVKEMIPAIKCIEFDHEKMTYFSSIDQEAIDEKIPEIPFASYSMLKDFIFRKKSCLYIEKLEEKD